MQCLCSRRAHCIFYDIEKSTFMISFKHQKILLIGWLNEKTPHQHHLCRLQQKLRYQCQRYQQNKRETENRYTSICISDSCEEDNSNLINIFTWIPKTCMPCSTTHRLFSGGLAYFLQSYFWYSSVSTCFGNVSHSI